MTNWQEESEIQGNNSVFDNLIDEEENIPNHTHRTGIKDINIINILLPKPVRANHGQSDQSYQNEENRKPEDSDDNLTELGPESGDE